MCARLTLLIIVTLLSACAGSQKFMGGSAVRLVETTALPVPTAPDALNGSRAYAIGPFDKLRIDVFGIPELSQRVVQADAGGRISFPIAGIVDAGGKTTSELESILRDRLRAGYIRDPQITVNLEQTVSQVITIDGEVREPGLYPVIGNLTMMRAIATAKGVSEFAKLDEVIVFRTVEGKRYAALYNLGAIRAGTYPDPDLYANDVVMVGNSRARRVFKDFLTILPSLASPLVLLLR
jgi:polysaccharide biosynthesis/export protein